MMTLKVGDVVTEIGGPTRLVKIVPAVKRYDASVRWKVISLKNRAQSWWPKILERCSCCLGKCKKDTSKQLAFIQSIKKVKMFVVCRQIKRRGRKIQLFKLDEVQLAETTMQKVEMRSKAIMKHLLSFSVQS